LEWHAGDAATTGAHGFVHLARSPGCAALVAGVAATTTARIRATISLGSPRSAAVRASGRLAKSTACIEILLAGGKGKTLATIAAGQCHVARHVVDGSLIRINEYDRPGWRGRDHRYEWVPSTREISVRTRNNASRASVSGGVPHALEQPFFSLQGSRNALATISVLRRRGAASPGDDPSKFYASISLRLIDRTLPRHTLATFDFPSSLDRPSAPPVEC